MHPKTVTWCRVVGYALCLAATMGWMDRVAAAPARPLLVTVDDLPIAGGMHDDPAERERITRGLLAALERHGIRAVGLVVWDSVRGPQDERLLEMWLQAGHELGNHSFSHLDFTRTDVDTFVADVERGRAALAEFLARHGKSPRFFRFPMLHEGETLTKLRAMRAYLERSAQRNLPVTIDNQDWSYERPWLRTAQRGDRAALAAIGEDYLAALRIATRHHERTGDWLFDRRVPQILLLHANAVGAAHWDRLFGWLASSGHRFATVDEVLADPAFEFGHEFVGPAGFGLWDRLSARRRDLVARKEVEELLATQAAAWNRGDLDGFCSVYADDATFVSPGGLTRGRDEILARYRRRYANRSAMGTLGLEVLEMRPAQGVEVSLLGDSRPGSVHGVSVAARWKLSYPDRDEASGLTLLVLRRGRDGWLIVQDASM